jgi:hypothetical protein
VLSMLLLLLLLLQIRTQPHLGCCLVAATAAASAIFMHLSTSSATPYTSRQHMRSCNDVNGNCANRRSRLTTAVAGHEKRRFMMWFMIPMVFRMPWTMLLLWPERCDHSMDCVFVHACVYDTSMLASVTYLWATIRGTSLPVTPVCINFA